MLSCVQHSTVQVVRGATGLAGTSFSRACVLAHTYLLSWLSGGLILNWWLIQVPELEVSSPADDSSMTTPAGGSPSGSESPYQLPTYTITMAYGGSKLVVLCIFFLDDYYCRLNLRAGMFPTISGYGVLYINMFNGQVVFEYLKAEAQTKYAMLWIHCLFSSSEGLTTS